MSKEQNNRHRRPVMALQLSLNPKNYGSGAKKTTVNIPIWMYPGMDPEALACFERGFELLAEKSDKNSAGNSMTPFGHISPDNLAELATALVDHKISVLGRTVWPTTSKVAPSDVPDIEDDPIEGA